MISTNVDNVFEIGDVVMITKAVSWSDLVGVKVVISDIKSHERYIDHHTNIFICIGIDGERLALFADEIEKVA